MPSERMTPRERWLAVLNHELPDRLPMDYWSTWEATQKLLKHLGCRTEAELFARLHIDRPAGIGARYVGPPVLEGQNVFGCRFRTVQYENGSYSECVHNPLAAYNSVEEIEAGYTWPSPDWWDHSVIPEQVKGKDHLPIAGGGSEPFLTYKELRGQELGFMDLVLNPEIVHYCLDKLFGLCYENTARIYEQIPGKVTYSYVAEDLGAQAGLLMSKAHVHEFLLPRMKRMMDLVHEAGAYVFFHSDGSVMDIIPDMIAAGIDVLNPIQWRCKGMARRVIKERFGADVALHGGVDNQQTLAFGTVEEVKAEVAENVRVLGEGGGYVLAPCHNIQVVSPPENIVAMYETAYALGWY